MDFISTLRINPPIPLSYLATHRGGSGGGDHGGYEQFGRKTQETQTDVYISIFIYLHANIYTHTYTQIVTSGSLRGPSELEVVEMPFYSL